MSSLGANPKTFWDWVERVIGPKESGPIVSPDRNVFPMGARVTTFDANVVGFRGVARKSSFRPPCLKGD